MEEFSSRRAKLFEAIPTNSVALIFSGVSKIRSEDSFYPFTANRNFFYLSGINQEGSILMLVKCAGEKKTYLFSQEHNELKERWTGKRISYEGAREVSSIDNVYSVETFDSMLEMALAKDNNIYGKIENLFLDLSDEIKIKTNSSTQIYAKELESSHPHLNISNIYPYIVELRMVKSPYEINQLEDAINATSSGINDLLLHLEVGMSEHELSDRFEYYGKTHNRKELAFETICAANIDATIMHHPVSQQVGVVGRNDLLLFDLGYQTNGYNADISRTYPVSGEFNDFQRKVYEAVLNCNKLIIDSARPGLKIGDLQELALKTLKSECLRLGLLKEEDDIKKYYIHNISHFLGLDTHDVGNREKPLEPGNVITVEPGLYFVDEGVGVRIEDDVLITETGARCLSKGIKKEINDIERMMKTRK